MQINCFTILRVTVPTLGGKQPPTVPGANNLYILTHIDYHHPQTSLRVPPIKGMLCSAQPTKLPGVENINIIRH